MKNLLILIFFVSVCAGFGVLIDNKPISRAPKIADSKSVFQKEREGVPDFSWTAIDGKSTSISSMKDQPLVLNFWATWCAPCVYEFPKMIQLAQKNPDTVFLFVSVDKNPEDIERFLKKYGDEEHLKNVVIAHDPQKLISMDLFGTSKYPETFLISKDHKIIDKIIGADIDWLSNDMQQKITALND